MATKLSRVKENKTSLIVMKCAFVFLSLIFCSCNKESKGYEDLDVLYADFVVNLKATPEELKQYCYKVTPDDGTIEFMKENNFSYRGLPEELEKRKLDVSIIGEKYFESVANFRQELVFEKQLETLQYIGREEPGEEVVDKKLGIYVTETFIILKSGSDTIRCKLGEMFKVNGKWKSFTEPKLGW